MSDILGPANATNAVTIRPADARSFSSLDSWFKDCTSPTADDGTDVRADWLNGMVAALRQVWRGNGNRLDGITPIIPEVGTDDAGVLKAVQHLVQRGQVNYAVDTGTANAVVVSLTPAPIELKSGLVVRFKKANSNNATGATTLTLNAFPAKNIKNIDGSNPSSASLLALKPYEVIFDAALDCWVLMGGAGSTDIFNLTKAPFADVNTFSYNYVGIPLNDTVNTLVNFQTGTIGPNNDCALVGGACKILTAGRYMVITYGVVGQHFNSNTAYAFSSAGLMKNGVIVPGATGNGLATAGGSPAPLKQANGSVSTIVDCAVNDVLNTYHYQVGGGAGFSVDSLATMIVSRVH